MLPQDKALPGAAPGGWLGQQSRGSLDLTMLIPVSFPFTLCKAHLFYPPEPADNPKHKGCGSCQLHKSFGHVVLRQLLPGSCTSTSEAQRKADKKSQPYLGHLTQAGDSASFVIYSEEHGGSLRGVSLEELQRFVQGLEEDKVIAAHLPCARSQPCSTPRTHGDPGDPDLH